MDVDYSVYEGRSVTGGSDVVLIARRVIARLRRMRVKRLGKFLRRKTAREYLT
jgi:hypothetical protein